MRKRSVALALALMCVPLIANCKDYYVRIGGRRRVSANIVLTPRACGLSWLTGKAWHHSEVQLAGPPGVHTMDTGCWERINDTVYVLQDRHPFWIAPDETGGDEYYRLDAKECNFRVPGVSFSDWRSGRSVAVDVPRNEMLIDNGPLCWRYTGGWLEEVDDPMVYSAFAVHASPLP